ncbi:hypothetical protein [Amycolatopsis anabasis]|uniref:hypothetical protein n=1 Tax=Amycolatopsis anabasis TaxID=1840409 RepID=UPI00131DF2A4|nr:hypothetical protein [Amycolatopsis anabasis]
MDRTDVRVELAFGADLAGRPAGWTWRDVTGDLLPQAIAVSRGRQDEAAQVQPSSCRVVLDNQHGHYTPNHPASPYFPHVVLGVPMRVSLPAGRTVLTVPGVGAATTPDTVASSVTGDLDIRVEATLDTWAGVVLASKWDPVTPALSWFLGTSTDEAVTFGWSPDGTTGYVFPFPPLPRTRRRALRVTLDVDNGRGGFVLTLYTADSISGPWTVAGDPFVAPITTKVFASAVPLRVGPLPDVESPVLDEIAAVQVRRGIDGPLVAAPDFTRAQPGDSTLTDSTGRVWTLTGGAALTDRTVRFSGFVAEWAPEWPYGDLSDGQGYPGESRVTVTASGVLRRLEQNKTVPPSPVRRAVLDTRPAPIAYWPCEDPAAATELAPVLGNAKPMVLAGDVTLAGVSDVDGSAPLPSFKAGQASVFLPRYPDTGRFSAIALLALPMEGVKADHTPLITLYGLGPGTAAYFALEASPEGAMRIRTRSALGGELETTVYFRYFPPNGRTVLVRFELVKGDDGSTTASAVLFAPEFPFGVGYAARFNTVFNPPQGIVLGGGWWVGQPSDFADLNGTAIGHLIATTSDQPVGDGLRGAALAWNPERAGDRLRRLAAENDIPLTVIGRTADTELMGPQRIETLPELLRGCAAIDGGILFETRSRPGLTYRTRASLYTQPAALSLDAARGPGDIAPGFAPVMDDRQVHNDVTISRPGGRSTRVTNQAHIAARGRYDTQVTLNVASDAQLPDIAAWELHLGTDSGMRYPQVAPALTANPDLLRPWLDLDLGDQIEVTRLPPQHPPGAVALLVQGYTETYRPHRIDAEVNASPARPWQVATTMANAPGGGHWRADTSGSVLTTAMGTDDRQCTVTTTAGPMWITTAEHGAQFPLMITVGGETMRVTAITGTRSPQSFTVERGTNGLVRPHPAGSAVYLATPATAAR